MSLSERPYKCNISKLCPKVDSNPYCKLWSYRNCPHYNTPESFLIFKSALDKIVDESEATEELIERVKQKMREGEKP